MHWIIMYGHIYMLLAILVLRHLRSAVLLSLSHAVETIYIVASHPDKSMHRPCHCRGSTATSTHFNALHSKIFLSVYYFLYIFFKLLFVSVFHFYS